ncbi:MAG: RES family NAD+ phosphorylase, partial [Pseudomonadota bacterium]
YRDGRELGRVYVDNTDPLRVMREIAGLRGVSYRTPEYAMMRGKAFEAARAARQAASQHYLNERRIQGQLSYLQHSVRSQTQQFVLTPNMVASAVSRSLGSEHLDSFGRFLKAAPGKIARSLAQTGAQFGDLALVGRAIVQNDIFGGNFDHSSYFLSDVGQYVHAGNYDTAGVLRNTFGTNALFVPGAVFYGAYDGTTSIREGDYLGAAMNFGFAGLDVAGFKGIASIRRAAPSSRMSPYGTTVEAEIAAIGRIGERSVSAETVARRARIQELVEARTQAADLSRMSEGRYVPNSRGIPEGITYEGTIHRATNPKYADDAWRIHAGNVSANHRYSSPGRGALYSGTSPEAVLGELRHYNTNLDNVVFLEKQVSVDNVLDLTNPSVRKQLDIDLGDLTRSSQDSFDLSRTLGNTNNDYFYTHSLGDFAQPRYNGILVPSARESGTSHLILFESLKDGL